MLKQMLIKSSMIFIILCVMTAINTAAQTQPTAFVGDSAKTQLVPTGESRTLARDCETDLAIANQRLNKALDALEKAEAVIASQNQQIEVLNKLDQANAAILARKDATIANQTKLIETYEKDKGTTISFFWGLVKYRKK